MLLEVEGSSRKSCVILFDLIVIKFVGVGGDNIVGVAINCGWVEVIVCVRLTVCWNAVGGLLDKSTRQFVVQLQMNHTHQQVVTWY